MKRNNIILVGMMGSGKSTVGKLLEEKLVDYNLVDIDQKIEDDEASTIPEIFETYTEIGFRRIESETILEACEGNNLIISTGGGAFENEENRKVLLNSGKVFYLYAPSELLYDRIKTAGNRPMLYGENPQEKFELLLGQRDINYRKADYIIDTESLNANAVADEILRRFNETVDIS